ncbi:MAG TPA: hypothetical protein ENG87_00855 [Candidatus Pacearchaeota archaeon]|nr:hypothetical protein BMS3Abin17_00251 [archaeon BMS3Abin17]HDK41899.1 hypothetical protein [Candidatus Pacearchaeota archaeon]HDZ60679.1 hypothetical protein [Candidatus Pacearchaeota archaeon]
MERREQLVIELFLGIILIIFLILMVFMFIDNDSESETITITDSYNTNSYNNYASSQKTQDDLVKNYIPSTKKQYSSIEHKYEHCDKDYLLYNHRGYHDIDKGVFGNDISRYVVYVRNREHKGDYFKVRFYFTDYYGKTRVESVTKYIKAGEDKKFIYQSIYDKYENCDWSYKVISQTESPGTVYSYRAEKRCY